jgi:hypothetical protein
LTPQNIKSGFNVIKIWPLNPRTMDNRITLSTIYTILVATTLGNEEGEGEEG